jgi:K+-sensing histidine kinase KdpD
MINCTDKNAPTLLVCIDTTNASAIALKYACLKAKKLGFKVAILSVIESSHKNLLFGSQTIGKEKRASLEKYLDKLINEITKDLGMTPVVSIREGDIATEIIKELKANPCCIMIVFGKSHSKSQSDSTVLPKMAQKIGRKIQVPITIVPEGLDENLFELLIK